MPTSAAGGAGARPWLGRGPPSGRPEDDPAPLMTRGPGSVQRPLDHLQSVTEPAIDPQRRRRLISRVDHAVLAPGVLPVTVLLPGGLVQQVVERRVVNVGDQVARP